MSSRRNNRHATRQASRPYFPRRDQFHHGQSRQLSKSAIRTGSSKLSQPMANSLPSSTTHPISSVFRAEAGNIQPNPSQLSAFPSPILARSARPRVQDAADDLLLAENSEVGMALDMQTNGVIGCAYFCEAAGTLYLQEETRITGMQLIESLLLQARPTTVIISSRAPEKLVSYLDRRVQGRHEENTGEDEDSGGFTLCTAVPSDYNPDAGKEALSQITSPKPLQPRAVYLTSAVENEDHHDEFNDDGHRPKDAIETEHLNIGTCVDAVSRITFGCVNAVLRYFERNAGYLGVDSITVRSVQVVSYSQCMFVAADTLFALQLLHCGSRRGHAQLAREGFSDGSRSVFDLFHSFALTTQGRSRLREMFIRPSTDLTVINERHESVATLLGPQSKDAVAAFRTALKKVKNIQPTLRHLRQGILLPGSRVSIKQSAWVNLRDFCTGVMQLLRAAQISPQVDCTIVDQAFREIAAKQISDLQESIIESIDFQESKAVGRTVAASGVDLELDEMKTTYDSLQIHLDNICRGYKSSLAHDMRQYITGCIFRPQMGYFTVTTRDPRIDAGGSHLGNIPSIFDSWQEVLREDGLIYFKTPEMEDADATYGDLTGRFIELEVNFFHRLGSRILEHEESLLAASEAIGEIDSILALAAAAEAFHLSRPQMTPENVLNIQKGRHILQERAYGMFFPNDCRLVGGRGVMATACDSHDLEAPTMPQDTPNTIVLTGPNHSGKSVYLKQVAIIVYLAHVGSFVPAEKAVIGVTDKILTRIATRESVSRDDSAFGADLRQAAFAINTATRRSLVLLDEFGKGTSTADGIALLDALLSHFLCIGHEASPKVLAATHFHEIFENGIFQEHPRLGLAHMRVEINAEATQSDEKVRFLYKLQRGRSAESFGCHCAAMNGVDPSVVDRAGRITKSLAQGATLEKICSELPESEIGQLQEVESQARRFLTELGDGSAVESKWQAPRDLLGHIFQEERVDGDAH